MQPEDITCHSKTLPPCILSRSYTLSGRCKPSGWNILWVGVRLNGTDGVLCYHNERTFSETYFHWRLHKATWRTLKKPIKEVASFITAFTFPQWNNTQHLMKHHYWKNFILHGIWFIDYMIKRNTLDTDCILMVKNFPTILGYDTF